MPMHDGCAPTNAHEYEADIHPSYAAIAAGKYSRICPICHPIHDFWIFGGGRYQGAGAADPIQLRGIMVGGQKEISN